MGKYFEYSFRQQLADALEPERELRIGKQRSDGGAEIALSRERGDHRDMHQVDTVALAEDRVGAERDGFPYNVDVRRHGEYDQRQIGIARLEKPNDFEGVALGAAGH